MSNKTKTPLVPKLRFPEFRGAGGWQPYILEELESLGWIQLGRGEVISGQDIKAIPGDYPIYSSSVKNNGLMGTYGRFMFDEELISWSVDGGGDFFHRPHHKFSVTNVSGYMRLQTGCLNYRFLANQLQALHASLTFDYQFKAHPSVIRKLYRLTIPSSTEQQKIADCLSSLDELIAAQARKVDALKTHKKGLMQQIFPREGETQPRFRFPEFKEDGLWERKLFSDLCDVKHGYAFESEFFSSEGEYVLLTPGNFYEQGGYRDRGELQKYFIGEIPLGYVLAKGDMLVAMTEQAAGLLGSPILVPESGKFLHNQRLGLVISKPDIAWANEFFFYVFNTDGVRKAIHDTASGAKVRHTSPTKIGDVMITVPTTLPEQQRIASCLSSLDALITDETQKLEVLKINRTGLMQQLFPSLEEEK